MWPKIEKSRIAFTWSFVYGEDRTTVACRTTATRAPRRSCDESENPSCNLSGCRVFGNRTQATTSQSAVAEKPCDALRHGQATCYKQKWALSVINVRRSTCRSEKKQKSRPSYWSKIAYFLSRVYSLIF